MSLPKEEANRQLQYYIEMEGQREGFKSLPAQVRTYVRYAVENLDEVCKPEFDVNGKVYQKIKDAKAWLAVADYLLNY